MNDATRAALVDSIAKRIDTFAEHVGYGDPDVTRDEASSYIAEIEEALLADRAVPEPDAERIARAAKAIAGLDWDVDEVGFLPTFADMARVALAAAGDDLDAVHAVHEALVNSAPDWMIDREDGELFDMARAALAAVPTVQVAAGDAPGLDELLDWYQCRLYTSSPNKWQAMISRSQDEWGADDQPVGFGPTRIAAVQSAVEKAKESQP